MQTGMQTRMQLSKIPTPLAFKTLITYANVTTPSIQALSELKSRKNERRPLLVVQHRVLVQEVLDSYADWHVAQSTQTMTQ